MVAASDPFDSSWIRPVGPAEQLSGSALYLPAVLSRLFRIDGYRGMTKDKTIRIAASLVIIAMLAVLWGRQSDLAYNVAQQRAILLGRYTLDTMIALLIITPILLCILRGIWKKKSKPGTPAEKRQASFRLISLILSIILAIVFFDAAMRLSKRKLYIGTEQSYHRTPERVYRGVFHDRPEVAFSYPRATPGYPEVPYVLTVDAEGFRNTETFDQYDWVVLGDSFAEGSSVSDEQVWTARLAESRHVRLYNLGMSGGSPVTYLDTLQKFGVPLNPKAVLYLLYEGNDFRNSNFKQHKLDAPKKATLSETLFKASPLRRLIKESLVRFLGPIGRNRYTKDPGINDPSHPLYPVAWLPIEIPPDGGYGYAFDLKRLEQHFLSEETFRKSVACTESMRLLEEARKVCDANGITLIVIYAPDTPHVLIDQIVSRVPPEQLHAFMGMRVKNLPAPEALGASLQAGTAVRETVLKQFCSENNIKFISLTDILKQKTAEGRRTYYSYDQHWTPEGHEVVAEYLSKQIITD